MDIVVTLGTMGSLIGLRSLMVYGYLWRSETPHVSENKGRVENLITLAVQLQTRFHLLFWFGLSNHLHVL